MKILTIEEGKETPLPSRSGLERVHKFDVRSISAVNAALAAQRPLLVRGDPGVGKTQLAEAVAEELGRAFYPFTVDSRTESRDLLWRFDAVMRLAEAQLYATLKKTDVENDLAVKKFVFPGPLWWAFNTHSVQAASGDASPLSYEKNRERYQNGWVVLIDEIDKAETDVPNGLLEALGMRQFTPLGYSEPISIPNDGIPPLIIITSNDERVLPDAFIRRCLVLYLDVPSAPDKLIPYLTERGRAHFRGKTTETILQSAAELLVKDRTFAIDNQLRPFPGQADYLDLLRAVIELAPKLGEKPEDLLEKVAQFTLKKHPTMQVSSVEGSRS